MTRNDPDSRPADVFGANITLHAGGGREAYLLLPLFQRRVPVEEAQFVVTSASPVTKLRLYPYDYKRYRRNIPAPPDHVIKRPLVVLHA